MGFDHSLIGLGKYPPSDFDIVAGLVALAERGHLEQLYVSQDMGGVKTRLLAYGGWGYAHTLNHVIPLFRTAGWDDAEVETLMVGNPPASFGFPVFLPGELDQPTWRNNREARVWVSGVRWLGVRWLGVNDDS